MPGATGRGGVDKTVNRTMVRLGRPHFEGGEGVSPHSCLASTAETGAEISDIC